MRAVVQRVSSASVRALDPSTNEWQPTGTIDRGLLVLVGVGKDDDDKSARALAQKVVGLRIFEDQAGKMNLDVRDVQGAILAVSQFTLFGDCRKGRRPSFVSAARPEHAEPLFDQFVLAIQKAGVSCQTGRFQTTMDVSLVNHGPVTLLIDTDKSF